MDRRGSPPRLARRVLRRLVGPTRVADVERSLEELFGRRLAERGAFSARCWYRRQVLGFALRWRAWRLVSPAIAWRVLLDDLHQGIRSLAHRPVFTTFVIAVLALGVASNTVVFAILDVALFRPLPFAGEERMFGVSLRPPGSDRTPPPKWADFARWREAELGTVEALIGYQTRYRALDSIDDGAPEEVLAQMVSPSFFAMLDVPLVRGRPIHPDDYRPDAEPVALISQELWQSSLGAREDILGRMLRLNRRPYAIVGVVADGFRFESSRPDVVVPLYDPLPGSAGEQDWVEVAVVSRAGETTERVQAELRSVLDPPADESEAERPVPELEPIRSIHYGWMAARFGPFMGVVAFVLLLVAANVANLTLVRTSNRRRELAVRSALGAARVRLGRQLGCELLMVSTAAGAIAVLLSYQGLKLLAAANVLSLGRARIVFDLRTAGFALVTALSCGAVAAVWPAVAAARTDLRGALGGSGEAESPGGSPLAGRALIVLQVACSLLLLTGAGLLTKTLVRMDSYDPGYDTRGLLQFGFSSTDEDVFADPAVGHAMADRLIDRVASIPGVLEATIFGYGGGSLAGRAGEPDGGVTVEGAPERVPSERLGRWGSYRYVTDRYFETQGWMPIQGRTFASLATGREAVAVLNDAAAEALWPGVAPAVVGRRFKLGPPESAEPWLTVIGVVPTTRILSARLGLEREPSPRIFLPFKRGPGEFWEVTVRAAVPSPTLVPQVREALADVDPRLMYRLTFDLDTWIDSEVADYAVSARIVTAFAGFGLVLALMGIYGVVAYGVARRTREIGIRKALGAASRDVLGTVLRESLLLAAVGIAIGLGLSTLLTDVLESMLYGTSPLDPAIFALVAAFTAVVVAAAAFLPARRATRLDPMVALRDE